MFLHFIQSRSLAFLFQVGLEGVQVIREIKIHKTSRLEVVVPQAHMVMYTAYFCVYSDLTFFYCY